MLRCDRVQEVMGVVVVEPPPPRKERTRATTRTSKEIPVSLFRGSAWDLKRYIDSVWKGDPSGAATIPHYERSIPSLKSCRACTVNIGLTFCDVHSKHSCSFSTSSRNWLLRACSRFDILCEKHFPIAEWIHKSNLARQGHIPLSFKNAIKSENAMRSSLLSSIGPGTEIETKSGSAKE
ncbi:hypothetical protein EVAR_33603_1 [Eumeta japonica]|uniref:Uncharacterized protein n=1 Tax=Eumeta variegata TaxID=151549 RepID=A0A4C1W913_EUMVA|nr:hypothetical protein EVAR_33603_1 [Eumeta japonica]